MPDPLIPPLIPVPALPAPPALTLGEARAVALADIDRIAGIVRSEHASSGFGQEMTYLAKEAEARACLRAFGADQTPRAADYPLLSKEVGITAATLAAVAQLVATRADAWRVLAGQIEAVRLAAKKQIRTAPSKAAVETIMTSLAWPAAEAETPEAETPGPETPEPQTSETDNDS